MSIVKNVKQYTNNNLADIISIMSHVKSKSGISPFNISNKNSLRNTLERINSKNKKNHSSKKNKNKSKDSELLINNYLSQRPRLNTEGNDNNLMKIKYSMDFFKNNKVFQVTNNKSTTNKKINIKDNTDNNFRKGKRNNLENTNKSNKSKISDNSNNILNKKKNTNFHFTRIVGNISNLNNKKIIENTSHNEYNNTNTQNYSHTQSYFNQNKKQYNKNNNKILPGNNETNKHRDNTKSEDIKKRSFVNNKIVKENKLKNFSGLLIQISPPNLTNNKLSHIQNYFRNIHKNKNIVNNQKVQQYNNEKNILTTEPKELNNTNRMDNDDLIIKDNSNYLVVSKNPTQITNIIEKKENNKYINNYFNICESINMKNKNNDNKNNNKSNEMEDENIYDTYEEIHFYFIQKIQKGKKLKTNMNNKKS